MDDEFPSAVPQLATLYNFDTDRDGDPGLILNKSSLGLSETDPNKFQVWRSAVLTSPLSITGDVLVDLWAKLESPTSNEIDVVVVYLRDYDAGGGGGYIEIASGAVYARDWQSNSTTFVERLGLMQGISYTVPAGNQLELRLIVDDASFDDMELAYDIASFTSLLNLSFVSPRPQVSFTYTTTLLLRRRIPSPSPSSHWIPRRPPQPSFSTTTCRGSSRVWSCKPVHWA